MNQSINICDYLSTRSQDDIIVDLREKSIFDFGTIPGAINIPFDNISQLYSLPKDRSIYLFCQAGEISEEAAELLTDAGYNAFNLSGGYREYIRNSMI